MLACFQTQHRVLIVVGVGCCNINDIDILISNKLGIRAVCDGGGGTVCVLEELLGAVCRAGGCGGNNGVYNVGHITCGRVDKKVFGKGYRAEGGQLMSEGGP